MVCGAVVKANQHSLGFGRNYGWDEVTVASYYHSFLNALFSRQQGQVYSQQNVHSLLLVPKLAGNIWTSPFKSS